MKVRELAIAGAWEITPQVHTDSRGLFFEWFTASAFTEFAGHRFDVRQANCSVSARAKQDICPVRLSNLRTETRTAGSDPAPRSHWRR